MMSLLRAAAAISALLERLAVIVASSGIVLMTVCILVQIIARYIFAEPPAWTEELARHAMIWSGFSGATAAFSRRKDPVLINNATLAREWMRRGAQFVEIGAVFTFSIAVLINAPAFMALHQEMYTETLETPTQIVVAIIPVSMAVILFHAAVRLLGLLMPTSGE